MTQLSYETTNILSKVRRVCTTITFLFFCYTFYFTHCQKNWWLLMAWYDGDQLHNSVSTCCY